MERRSRPLDSIREILDSAEELDLTLSGGAILHDEELGLYVDALLADIQAAFKGTAEVAHHERTATGVVLNIVPQSKTTAVYRFCKLQVDTVDTVDYDYRTEKIGVSFGVRPPVRFCETFVWVCVLYALAAVCVYVAQQSISASELWVAFVGV
jgi:hypothetical protein